MDPWSQGEMGSVCWLIRKGVKIGESPEILIMELAPIQINKTTGLSSLLELDLVAGNKILLRGCPPHRPLSLIL